jgi:hypothetical protein
LRYRRLWTRRTLKSYRRGAVTGEGVFAAMTFPRPVDAGKVRLGTYRERPRTEVIKRPRHSYLIVNEESPGVIDVDDLHFGLKQ